MDKVVAQNLEHPAFHRYNRKEAVVLQVLGSRGCEPMLLVRFDDGRELVLWKSDNQYISDKEFTTDWLGVGWAYAYNVTAYIDEKLREERLQALANERS